MEKGVVAVKTRRTDRLTEIHKTTTITRTEKSCNEGKRRQTTKCLGEDASQLYFNVKKKTTLLKKYVVERTQIRLCVQVYVVMKTCNSNKGDRDSRDRGF